MENQDFKLHDQHVHTCYSADSRCPIKEHIEKAITNGCRYFAVTDHLDLNIFDSGNSWIADYKAQRVELNQLQEEYKDRIILLQGIEVGYKTKEEKGLIDISESLDFDLVNLSIHDFKDIDFYYPDNFIKDGIDNIVNLYLDCCLSAVKSNVDYNVFCHIDYGFKTAYQLDKTLRFSHYEDKIIKVLKVIIEKDKTLEINTKVQEWIDGDENARYLLRLYRSLGGKYITISSDAHESARYLSSFEQYAKIAKEEGFDYLCYFIKKQRHLYKI